MKKLLLALTIIATAFIGMHGTAKADVNNFTITSFTSNQVLSNQDKQGKLNITENISIDFSSNNHGIYRSIPVDYKNHKLGFKLENVSSESGAPTEVDQSKSNGNIVVRIGDPDSTVTGNQEYTIKYSLTNVIRFFKNHDELYIDVNGDQWKQPIDEINVKLGLPSNLKLTDRQPICFSGSRGSTEHDCSIRKTEHGLQASSPHLDPEQNLTYVAGFQKGYFTPPTTADFIKDNLVPLFSLIIIPLLSLIVGFLLWFKKGRDAKGKGTIVPQYTSPEGLSPLEAGTLADFSLDNRDFTATIIDLARRGHINIIEIKKDRLLLSDKLSYQLKLMKANTSKLNKYESSLLSALFPSLRVGELVKIGDRSKTLATTAQSLKKSVYKDMTSNKYFKSSPKRQGVSVLFFVVIAIGAQMVRSVIPEFNGSIYLILGFVVGAAIVSIFIYFMPSRSAKGVAAREHLLGLKMYMETAEKERMQKLEGPNAKYAKNSSEPKHTVEFFEKLLPYAIVLGVENEWAKQFKNIYKNPPAWYSGSNYTVFSAGYLASSLSNNISPAISSSFSAPSSSGGSGFSAGGGFSGGGFGGGGGGGW